MRDTEDRVAYVERIKRTRTPLERYEAELDLLYFDMDYSRVWNVALTREFMIRLVEIEHEYAESLIKPSWTRK